MFDPHAERFPYVAFNPRNGIPLVVRLGLIARYRLARVGLARIEPKPAAPFRLLSMAGADHLHLLRESLHSFARHASGLPKLTIVSDGSLDGDGFRAGLDFWPGAIEVLMPDAIMAGLPAALRGPLGTLVEANPLGLKLAAIIAQSARGPQLFVDSDILWFLDPIPILTKASAAGGVAVTREEGCSVNRELAARHAPELLEAPSSNTGCVLTTGDIGHNALLAELLEEALNTPDDEFNEQTILSILATRSGGYLPERFCLVGFEDAQTVRRRWPADEGYCSRHYVRYMRHQFYRDALASHRRRVMKS